MKKIRQLAVFNVFLLLFMNFLRVSAMNTGFSTTAVNEKEQETFWNNLELSLLTDEVRGGKIKCFDVDAEGRVAIGLTGPRGKYISVYDSDGAFQYGYSFDCGQDYGVQWDGTNLLLYFVRSDMAVSLDESGQKTELRAIEQTIENNSYWNHVVFSDVKTVGEVKYEMRNRMGPLNLFASSYSQLVKTDGNGDETILYDVSRRQLLQTVAGILAVLAFLTIAIATILRQVQNSGR